MLEAEAVVATSSEHPIRSLKPELGIGTRRVVWAHCTAAHADAPPARAGGTYSIQRTRYILKGVKWAISTYLILSQSTFSY